MSQLQIRPAHAPIDPPARSYGPVIVGFTLTILALHLVVTRPLLKHIDGLNTQIASMRVELDEVSGSQNDAWRTNDLLTALTIQAERLDSADLALNRFDMLAARLTDLNGQLVALSKSTGHSMAVVEDFDSLQDRIAVVAGDAGAIDSDLGELAVVTNRLDALAAKTPQHRDSLDVLEMQSSEMTAIATRLAMETQTVDEAAVTLGKLSELTAKLEGTETAKAASTATELIGLAGQIESDGSALIKPATEVLASLRQATGELDDQGERLESLIVSAEVLEDFETELAHHIRGLEDIRRELIDFAMLGSTFERLASTLEPLTRMAKLRRLQPQDLQLVVDGLKEHRENSRVTIPARTMISENEDVSEKVIRTAERLVPEPVQMLR